jgi:hypothetical protein
VTFEFTLESGYGTPPIWHHGPAEEPNVRARTKKLCPPWSQTWIDLPKASLTCTPNTAPLPTWAALRPSPTALQCAAGIMLKVAGGGGGTQKTTTGRSSKGIKKQSLAMFLQTVCSCAISAGARKIMRRRWINMNYGSMLTSD